MNHQRTFWLKLFPVLLLLALLLPAAALAEAPTGADDAAAVITFRGPIEVKGTVPGEWTIAGVALRVTERTRIRPGPNALEVGDVVQVVAQKRGNDMPEATLIQFMQRPAPMVVFHGPIEAMSETAWKVGDRDVAIDSNTAIVGDSPDVGDQAQVWAEVRSDQSLLAKKILVHDAKPKPQEVAFRGVVQSVDGNTWKILVAEETKTVMTDANTRIVGSPQVGDKVGVRGLEQEDGSVLAKMIVKLVAEEEHAPFAGFIGAIEPNDVNTPTEWLWTVNLPAFENQPAKSWLVRITADTNLNVQPQDVKVGDWVRGEGTAAEDGSILAAVAKIIPPPRVQVVGEVLSVPPAETFPKGDWLIGTTVVHVTERTMIRGTPPTLHQQAYVVGELKVDGSLDALLLRARRSAD